MLEGEKAPQSQPRERLMLIICRYRHLDAIVEEVGDWCKEDGGKILLYGLSEKARDGFLLTCWTGPLPTLLREKFVTHDRDIFDVITYEENLPQDEQGSQHTGPKA